MLDKGGQQLLDILGRAVGSDKALTAFEAIQGQPSVSVRINPAKVGDPESFALEHFGKDVTRVPWSPFGYALCQRPQFTLDPLFHAGCYYVQDSSAMAVGHLFRTILDKFDGLDRPLRVLDLCAAPGGKSTDLAASLRQRFSDRFVLVANEVMRNRATILADNMALWGDPNVVVTNCDPKAFAKLEGFFDVIVADVPCSGEGMFRKDEEAVEDWSEDAVALCASRQRRILADVWPSLREGGVLVYSTCTFEESENDANVEWAASELGGEVFEYGWTGLPGLIHTRTGALLVPGFVSGEGQFASAVVKTASQDGFRLKGTRPVGSGTTKVKGDLRIHIPETVAKEMEALEVLHPIQAGVAQGFVKGKDFVPSADLALSIGLEEDAYPRSEVDIETALKFLHRDTIALPDAPKGFVLVCFEGHPLGFVKNLGNRCNNLHPQNRRIRMDISQQ